MFTTVELERKVHDITDEKLCQGISDESLIKQS